MSLIPADAFNPVATASALTPNTEASLFALAFNSLTSASWLNKKTSLPTFQPLCSAFKWAIEASAFALTPKSDLFEVARASTKVALLWYPSFFNDPKVPPATWFSLCLGFSIPDYSENINLLPMLKAESTVACINYVIFAPVSFSILLSFVNL